MSQNISPIINPQELTALMKTKPVVLVDARAGGNAKERYTLMHVDAALYVDMECDLAGPNADPAKGGRHPLPDRVKFSQVLQQLGITPESHVIIYDDKSGSNAAARFWWMLRSIGHETVQVLNGGFNAAVSAGLPVSTRAEIAGVVAAYEVGEWKLPLANMSEVEAAAQYDNYVVIDVRDAVRFNGENELIDIVAGHIPGAVNIPFSSNLDADGFYLTPAELKDKYVQALKNIDSEQVIVHCGSGVTACHTLLAMDYAGMEIPKLYVGSWSEWCRNDKPVATAAKLL